MELTWTAHPLKTDRKKSVFLVIIILLTCLLVLLTTNNAGFALIALALLIFSMRQYFMPTTYILNAEGVEVRFSGMNKKRPWGYFSSYYEDRNGILLSPFKEKSRLESFRGIYLIASGNKTEIAGFVKQYIK